MRLWHYRLISVLPDLQLLSQWRELIAIASRINRLGFPNHILVNRVMEFSPKEFLSYADMIVTEMKNRNYEVKENLINTMTSMINSNASKFSKAFVDDESIKKPFKDWHNYRYLTQCFYNLQEKYDCGRINHTDWEQILKFYLVEPNNDQLHSDEEIIF